MNIHATKEEVWDVVFNQFGDVAKFNPVIDSSKHHAGDSGEIGCERECQIDSRHKVVERITDAKENEWMEIDIIDGGLPMMGDTSARFEIKDGPEGTTHVVMKAFYVTKPRFMAPLMKPMMKKLFFRILVGLKYYLETGETATKDKYKGISKLFAGLKPDQAFQQTANLKAA